MENNKKLLAACARKSNLGQIYFLNFQCFFFPPGRDRSVFKIFNLVTKQFKCFILWKWKH